MSTLFLINPASGRKRNGAKVATAIRNAYEKEGQSVRIEEIDFNQLDHILDEAIADGVDHIFAVGGDGTVNAIGTRLINRPVNFGVIPKGSGNGYARNIGFSIRLQLAISQAMDAKAKKVDTGRFGEWPFLNVAGVGLDAEVAWQFSVAGRRGFVPYVRSSAERLFSMAGESYTLFLDGKKKEVHDIVGIIIANGTQWGYDAKISVHASLTDGQFDVLIVRRFPIIKAGFLAGKLFNGKFQNSRYVEVIQAKEVIIQRADRGPAQVDGEPIEAGKEIPVSMLAGSLNLLLPTTLTPEKAESL